MYVRTYVCVGHPQECQFGLICTIALTCKELMHHVHWRWRRVWAGHEIETRGQGRMAFLDNGGWGGQRGWSSATYVFCVVECWTQPMVGDAEKQKAMKSMYKRSQVQEGKREQEKLQRKKHVVESLHKQGIKYDAHFHVRFNRVLRTELLHHKFTNHKWPIHMHGAAWSIMRMRIPSNILYMRSLCDFVFRSLQSYLCNMMVVLAPTLYFYNCIKCYKNSLWLCISQFWFCPVCRLHF